MKVTLDIPDGEYGALERMAAAEGVTVEALILRAIDRILAEGEGSLPRLTEPILKAEEPGSLKLDNEMISDLLDPLDE